MISFHKIIYCWTERTLKLTIVPCIKDTAMSIPIIFDCYPDNEIPIRQNPRFA